MLDAYIIQKILDDKKKKEQEQDDNRPRVYIDVFDIPLEERIKETNLDEESKVIVIQL
jgi:hypothetical protein